MEHNEIYLTIRKLVGSKLEECFKEVDELLETIEDDIIKYKMWSFYHSCLSYESKNKEGFSYYHRSNQIYKRREKTNKKH